MPDRPGDRDDWSERATRAVPRRRTPREDTVAGLGLEPDRVFGGYRLTRLLGSGGFAQVWQAEHLASGRDVALKILAELKGSSEESIARFEQEGRIAASLSHPNCVYVFGTEEVDGVPAIAMEIIHGGSLQDVLDSKGPLAVMRAVDLTLDIVDGLEAARRIGVVHRDVKPSNCYVDDSGRARIGDFGISKSLDADARLTATGTFLGTPAFASPEQVRGRPADFRSDVYSLGATLHALLTGKPPFEATNAGDLVARIVGEKPTGLREHRADVPRGLERAVLRMLEKDADRRPKDYATVRDALVPYSSQSLPAAPLARRFGAYVLDALLTYPVTGLIVVAVGGFSATFDPTAPRYMTAQVAANACLAAYFATCERLWRRTPGKLAMGLQVTTPSGGTISTVQALVRSACLPLAVAVVGTAVTTVTSDFRVFALAWIVVYGAILGTMRRRNGFAGLHDLLSTSRVRVARAPSVDAALVELVAESAAALGADPLPSRAHGPFRVVGVEWDDATGQRLLVGSDDELHRRVWIHESPATEASWHDARRDVSRPGRLRFLQGGATAAGSWHAYEAPGGASLLDVVATRGRLDWAPTRRILLDLAVEIEAALPGSDLPPELSLRHVWIDGLGRTRLLDFPSRPLAGPDDPTTALPPDSWPQLLHQVLLLALDGQVIATNDLGRRSPTRDLPGSAESIVDATCSGTLDTASLPGLVSDLRSAAGRPTTITLGRRLAHAALVLLLAFYAVGVIAVCLSSGGELLGKSPTDARLHALASRDKALDTAERQALVTCLARERAHGIPGWMMLAGVAPNLRTTYREVLAETAAVTPAEADAACAALRDDFGWKARDEQAMRRRNTRKGLLLLVACALPLVSAVVFRRPPLMRACGLALLGRDGRTAPRWRRVARAAATWAPWILLALASGLASVAHVTGVKLLAAGAIAVGLAGIAWMPLAAAFWLANRERGLADRIAGTRVAPW